MDAQWLMVLPWCVLLYFQNMAFSWSSRSRNSGDPAWHRKAAWFSNGIWFFSQGLMITQFIETLKTGEWWRLAVLGVLYTLFTTEGSVAGMKQLLKRESGKRQVGAR